MISTGLPSSVPSEERVERFGPEVDNGGQSDAHVNQHHQQRHDQSGRMVETIFEELRDRIDPAAQEGR